MGAMVTVAQNFPHFVDVIRDNSDRIIWSGNKRRVSTSPRARHKLHLKNCDMVYLDEHITALGLKTSCDHSPEYPDVV
ncbi:hypothetical protein Neosp_015257 [[Neocosmospora] mangrovei]